MQVQTMGKRGIRQPVHRAAKRIFPFEISPFYFQAFLPGETVFDLYLDGRFMVNGLKSQLYPWYLDVQIFKVNLLDLGEEYSSMFLNDTETAVDDGYAVGDPGFGVGWSDTATDGGDRFSLKAYEFVVKHAWEIENKEWLSGRNAGLHMAPPKWRDWTSSLVESSTGFGQDIAPADLTAEHFEDLVEVTDTMAEVLKSYGVRQSKRQGVPERVMWESLMRYPVATAPDDPSETLNRFQILWQLRESRLTGSGMFFDQPGFLIGLVTARPEVIHGNINHFFANDLIDRDRWFVPPFNVLDAPQLVKQDPRGAGWTDVGDDLVANTLDYWLMGESYTDIDRDGALYGGSADPAQLIANLADTPFTTGAGPYTPHSDDLADDVDFQTAAADTPWGLNNASRLLQSDAWIGGHAIVQTKVKSHLVGLPGSA